MNLYELCTQYFDSARYEQPARSDWVRISQDTLNVVKLRQQLHDEARPEIKHLLRSLFSYDFSPTNRLYVAQPLSESPTIGYKLAPSGFLTLLKERALSHGVMLLDTSSEDFHYLTCKPLTHYTKDANDNPLKVVMQESADMVDNLIVEADYAIIDSCDTLLLDVTQNYSAGASMEALFAYSRGKRVIAVHHDDYDVSPWVKRHSTMVITETQLSESLRANTFDF